MSEMVVRILAQVDALSQQDRAELAQAVLRSLEPEEPDAIEEWDKELARRVTRFQNGQAVEIPAEQVFANWRRKSS